MILYMCAPSICTSECMKQELIALKSRQEIHNLSKDANKLFQLLREQLDKIKRDVEDVNDTISQHDPVDIHLNNSRMLTFLTYPWDISRGRPHPGP